MCMPVTDASGKGQQILYRERFQFYDILEICRFDHICKLKALACTHYVLTKQEGS
jgi:hypothetical protein